MPGQPEIAMGTAWGTPSLLVCWTQTCSVSSAGSFALGAAASCVRGGMAWSNCGRRDLLQEGMINLLESHRQGGPELRVLQVRGLHMGQQLGTYCSCTAAQPACAAACLSCTTQRHGPTRLSPSSIM